MTHHGFHRTARAVFLLLACALGATVPAVAARAAAAASQAPDLGNSVVKVFSTMRYPDPYKPWTKQAPVDVTGSGVIIEGKRILTNAHVVLYASQVQVQANEAGDKMAATVVAVAPDIDLAVLQLEDESFFDARPPIARASKLPEIKDTVLAYGYPTGGNSLSITKGIVSRIEFVPYKFPVSGLRIQIDAAINPGNSGGPAIADDRMIGLAFRKLTGDDNIGYIIPNEEIELFLKDIADGKYDGKPAMYDDLQTLENPALRNYLKLDKSVEGVIVHEPYQSEAGYPLKQWDVITRIGAAPIDNQGMVRIGHDLRVDFHYLVQKTAAGGFLPLSIVRNGQPLQIKLPVSSERPTLVRDLDGSYPSYFVYGPIVFSRATWEFVGGIEKTGAGRALSVMKSPLLTRALDPPDADLKELVVVSSPFFPDKLARGYSNVAGSVVESINGQHISSLVQLVALLRDLKDEFVIVEFAQRTGESLVFPRKDMAADTEAILTDNGVRAQGSPDTLAVWQAAAATQAPNTQAPAAAQ
jgi:S1-C subfamily serine protease